MIEGQCENCGKDYRMLHNLHDMEKTGKEPICPHCKKETQNWDTVNGSMMAPRMIEITKE